MKKSRLLSAVCACLSLTSILFSTFILLPGVVLAAFIPVDWYNAETGNLNGAAVTFDSGTKIGIWDLTESAFSGAFSAAPLTEDTEIVEYSVGSDWTATFDQEISGLLLYVYSWRGNSSGVSPTVYSFSESFTILSGLDFASVSGNTLSITSSLRRGVIQFTAPVSSITVNSNSTAGSLQGTTFAINSIPIPAALWLFGSGLLGLMGIARRKAA